MDGDNYSSRMVARGFSSIAMNLERTQNPVNNSDIKKKLEEAHQEKERNDKSAATENPSTSLNQIKNEKQEKSKNKPKQTKK